MGLELRQPSRLSLGMHPRDKPSPPFAAEEDAPSSSALVGEVEEKTLSLLKWLFLLSLRPCRGNAEGPEQNPTLYDQGVRPPALLPQHPHWLSTSFKRAKFNFSFFGPMQDETSKSDSSAPSSLIPTGSDKWDCKSARAHLRPALAFCLPLPATTTERGAQPAQIRIGPGKLSLPASLKHTAKPALESKQICINVFNS